MMESDDDEETATASAASEGDEMVYDDIAEPELEPEAVEMGSDEDERATTAATEAENKVLIGHDSNNPYYVLQELDVGDLFESNVNIKYDMSVDNKGSLNMDSEYLTISDDEMMMMVLHLIILSSS